MANNERSKEYIEAITVESAQRLWNISRANKRCNGLFLSHIFRESSEIKASENLAHHRDRKNYNNLKNYNRLSKWDSALSLANNFSLSLSSGREWKGRRKNPSQEGEEEHRFNSESFSRECSPDKNLPPSINLLVFLTLENVNETLSTFNNPAAAGSALFFHRPV